MKNMVLTALGVGVALLVSGCQRSVIHSISQQLSIPPRAKMTEEEYVRHTVQRPGETLSHIAQWYTGKTQHWETIAAHNRSIDANGLRKGDVVRIPVSIVITRQAMPQNFVQELPAKSKPLPEKNYSPPAVAGVAPKSPGTKTVPGTTVVKPPAPRRPPATPPVKTPAAPAAILKPPVDDGDPPKAPAAVPPQIQPDQLTLYEPVEGLAPSPPQPPERAAEAAPNAMELFGPIQ